MVYRRLSLSAFLAALLTQVAAVQAAELGAFFPYTLYTQEDVQAEAFKPKVLLMLHGFKSAMPNHDYGVFHEHFAAGHTVAGFNYNYTDVTGNLREFDELFASFLNGRRVAVVGTSLGGFWADYLVNRYDIDGAILVNPSVQPQDTMRRALGKQYSKKRQETFTVTEEHVQAYAKLDLPERKDAKRLVLLCKDDEILDYRVAAEAFAGDPNTKVVVFEEGGHNLALERPDVMAVIQTFMQDL